MPQEGRRVPCRASQLWVPLPWCPPPLPATNGSLRNARAMGQTMNPGCCPIPSVLTHPGWHLGCALSIRTAQAAPLQSIQVRIWAGQLLTQRPAPAAQSQHSVPMASLGMGQTILAVTQCPQEQHTHTHGGGTLGKHWEKSTQRHRGDWASGVAQGSAGAGHLLPTPAGRAQLQQSQGGIWESAATSCRCPSRRLEPPGSGPWGGWSWPAAGLGGCASQPRREMGYNQSWKRFPAQL